MTSKDLLVGIDRQISLALQIKHLGLPALLLLNGDRASNRLGTGLQLYVVYAVVCALSVYSSRNQGGVKKCQIRTDGRTLVVSTGLGCEF